MSVAINIENVAKRYGDLTIIPNLSANIKNGELFTLLGPSGCGKTTLLRMIAGFNTIEAGEIKFDSEVINTIPAYNRNIGIVFQNYAIFPHLTVKQNVTYGLKLRKLSKTEIENRTKEILDVVKITEYKDRLPEKLSGGQQQRVALARAIVIHPSVLLMDEPLSNLDAKLRVEMRAAIKSIQKKVGITTVYVTHDQEEALAISDRIAVMNKGEINQIGCPESIYTRPFNVFVSTFIGHSNLFLGKIKKQGSTSLISFKNGYEVEMNNLVDSDDGKRVIISVRPEEFIENHKNALKAKIISRTFLGKYVNYELDFGESTDVMNDASIEYSQDLGHAERIYEEGEEIYLAVNKNKINIFDFDKKESMIKGVTRYE